MSPTDMAAQSGEMTLVHVALVWLVGLTVTVWKLRKDSQR